MQRKNILGSFTYSICIYGYVYIYTYLCHWGGGHKSVVWDADQHLSLTGGYVDSVAEVLIKVVSSDGNVGMLRTR